MKIVVYALDTCAKCRVVCKGLEALKYPVDIQNADDPRHEQLLDSHGVDVLPFVQLIDDVGAVVWHKRAEDGLTLKDIVDEVKHRTGTSGEPS